MSRLRLAAAGIASLAILGTAAYSQEGQGRRPDSGQGGAAQQGTSQAPGISKQERSPAARGVERGNSERASENRTKSSERRQDSDKTKSRASDDDNRRRNAEVPKGDRKNADTRRSDDSSTRTNRTAEPKSGVRDRDRTKSASPADSTKADRDRTKSATSPSPANGKSAERNGPRERVQLSEQQRTTIRDTIVRERPQRVTNVNVNIRVGSRIPRSVRLLPLPVVLVTDYPAYRDYRYAYIRDEICIIDPVSYEIVEVIDARDGARGVRQAELVLSGDDQRFVYEAVIDRGPRLNLNLRLGIGADVPRSVEVHRFPERVVSRVPRLADYRFVIDQDQVVVVSPGNHDIALVISR